MRNLKWIAQNTLKNLGWQGLTGLALLASMLLLYFGVLLPAQSRLGQLQIDAALAKASMTKLAHDKRSKDSSAPDAVKAFYQQFPAKNSTPDWLGKIYTAAANQSLQLSQGEYKFIPSKAGKLGSYQINLPIKGSYVQIRKFIVQVLNDAPVASLDEISFKRETIGNAMVEAKVRLTLYLEEI